MLVLTKHVLMHSMQSTPKLMIRFHADQEDDHGQYGAEKQLMRLLPPPHELR